VSARCATELRLVPGNRVLDLAAGTGKLTRAPLKT
jgi:ubiquinone/menaquinone biosynthesis C-methylase UbiE